MNDPQNAGSVQLPERLRHHFREVRKRLWRTETIFAVTAGLTGLVLSYFAVFVSDRIWDTPGAVRGLFFVLGLGVVAGAIFWWVERWILKPRDERALASLVQRKFRRLGDRLLGIVELADERTRPAHYSPELYRAAIQQVSGEAERYSFAEAVDDRPVRRWSRGAVVVLGCLLMLVLVFPQASWNAFARWMAPGSEIPRFTLVELNGWPEEIVVPHGEGFTVAGRAVFHSFWRPAKAEGRLSGGMVVGGEVGEEGEIAIEIPARTREEVLRLALGDAVVEVRVRPVHRPSIRSLQATVVYPEYLGYGSEEEKVQGTLRFLEGSEIQFKGEANRTLRRASLLNEEGELHALQVDGAGFKSPLLDLGGSLRCQFICEDEYGLTNAVAWPLVLERVRDQAPRPDLPRLGRNLAILETEVLEVYASGRDDYGVKEIGVEWQLGGGETNQPVGPRYFFQSVTPKQKQLQTAFYLSPSVMQVPADSVIELKAWATDFYPGRERVESEVYRILVVGVEQHAEMIRNNLENLLSNLEEVTRLEEKIAAETTAIQNMAAEEQAGEETGEELEGLAQEQRKNAEMLEGLAKAGGQMLREAMRNPAFDAATLSEWSKMLQEMSELGNQEMQQAAGALKSGAQNSSSRAGDVAEAMQKEEEILEALQRMQLSVNQELDQLQAMTLAQRLRKVGGEEKELEGRLQEIVPATIGLLPRELPSHFQQANQRLAGKQSEAQSQSAELQGEISRFFERTQREPYGKVSVEMEEAATARELDRLRELIEQNISMQAIQRLGHWSERFAGWADLLQPESSEGEGEGGGGGGGGEAGGEDEMMKHLVELLRLREGEVTLRHQTELLDKRREDQAAHEEGAERLAKRQLELQEDLQKVQAALSQEEFGALLADAYENMEQAQALLSERETGGRAVQLESLAIQMLSDTINLINEQSQKQNNSSQSQQQQQQISFLMQMMAQQGQGSTPGQEGGRSTAGGETERANQEMEGDMEGGEPDARSVGKGSGWSGEVPVEFREALQKFYNALEREEEAP